MFARVLLFPRPCTTAAGTRGIYKVNVQRPREKGSLINEKNRWVTQLSAKTMPIAFSPTADRLKSHSRLQAP